MTQKEKLANEYIQLKREFDGEEFKENLTQNQVWYLTKEFRVIDLQKKIEYVRNAIEAKQKRLAKEAWFKTEEGKAFKEEKETELQQLRQQGANLRKNGYEHTRKVVRELLGERWDVTSFCDRSMEIGIAKGYREDGSAMALFGHEFNITFDKKWTEDDYTWEMNYGTMGGFDLEKDNDRIEFLVGMAKFASDTTVIPALKEYLHTLNKSATDNIHAIYKVENELECPKALVA